jgi:cell division protein FtsA
MTKNKATNEKIIIGLDIGTTKICAIVGTRNENGKINVLGIGKSSSLGGVAEGMVCNINKTSDAITRAVKQASAMANVNIGSVYVGIAGRHIRSFSHSITVCRENPESEVTEKELEDLRLSLYRMNTEPGNRILHVLPQEYQIDGQVSDNPESMPGSRFDISYHIITGQMLAAENIRRSVEKSGVSVKDIVVEPIASAKAVLTEEEMKAGVAILDIGGGTSDLAIFHDGRIRHTTVIPIGGQKITKDICEAFRIMEHHAEQMKVKYGNAYPQTAKQNEAITVPGINGRQSKLVSVKNLSLVINARLTELFRKVDFEIQASGYAKKLNAGIVLTGGGAEMTNVGQLLEFIAGQEVKVGYPNQHIAKGIVAEVKSPMYATGAGLVIYGMEREYAGVEENTNSTQKTKKEPQEDKFYNKLKKFGGSFLDIIKEDDSDFDFKN